MATRKKTKVTTNPNIEKIFVTGTRRGLELAAKHVLAESNKRVPLEDKELMESGDVSVGDITAAVFYSSEYSLKQHEDQRLEHANGRTAKFLENAFTAEREAILEIVAKELKGKL